MPIVVNCRCGQRVSAGDKLAGQSVACPKCKQPLVIPQTEANPSFRLEDLLDEAGAAPVQQQVVLPKKGPRYSGGVSVHWPKLLTVIAVCGLLLAAVVVACVVAVRTISLALRSEPPKEEKQPAAVEVAKLDTAEPDVARLRIEAEQREAEPAPVPPDKPEREPGGPHLSRYRETARLVFTPDADRLLTAGKHGRIRCWDVRSGLLRAELGQVDSRVLAMAVSQDGRLLGIKTPGSLELWELPSGKPHHKHAPAVELFSTSYVGFSHDDARLVTGFDQAVVAMNVADGAILTLPYGRAIMFMAASPVEPHVALVKRLTKAQFESADRTLADFGVDWMNLDTGEVDAAELQPESFVGATGAVALSADGKLLAASLYGGPLVVLETAGGKRRTLMERTTEDSFFIHAKLLFSPYGNALVGLPVHTRAGPTPDGSYPPELWRLTGGGKHPIGATGAEDIALSRTGLLAVAAAGEAVRFYDLETGEEKTHR